jgi:hypothetical protein
MHVRIVPSLLAPGGSRLVAKTRRCQRRERGFESRLPLQGSVRGGVAKTARHLPAKQIIGSAILPTVEPITRYLPRTASHVGEDNRRAGFEMIYERVETGWRVNIHLGY